MQPEASSLTDPLLASSSVLPESGQDTVDGVDDGVPDEPHNDVEGADVAVNDSEAGGENLLVEEANHEGDNQDEEENDLPNQQPWWGQRFLRRRLSMTHNTISAPPSASSEITRPSRFCRTKAPIT